MEQQPVVEKKRLVFVGVYESLYEMIATGTFPPGSWLPSEPKLATMLGVSRMTLRQALAMLKDDGLIEKIQGKGNLVAEKKATIVPGLTTLGNPIHQCCLLPIDSVEVDFRIEVPTEYELVQLQRRTVVSVAVDRWYRSGDKIVAYTLSLLPIETLTRLGIDLHSNAQLEQLLEKDIYDMAVKSQMKLQMTHTGDFISAKYVVTETETIYLLHELIYDNMDELPLALNKHYIVPEFFSLEMNRIK